MDDSNMNNGKLYSPNLRIASESILGGGSLLCGCLIYLLFRSENINIYKWCSSLVNNIVIPKSMVCFCAVNAK